MCHDRYMNTAPAATAEATCPNCSRCAALVKPKVCTRCSGTGLVSSGRVHAGAPGGCFGCAGHGLVEGDRATLAAAKAAAEAFTALRRDAVAALVAAGVPNHKACNVLYAINHLQENAPARYDAALASYAARHPGLARALWAYAAEHGFVLYGATPVSVDAALAMLDA
jgi:hypothetical protein